MSDIWDKLRHNGGWLTMEEIIVEITGLRDKLSTLRNDTLEEAAQVAHDVPCGCASAIRALKEKKG